MSADRSFFVVAKDIAARGAGSAALERRAMTTQNNANRTSQDPEPAVARSLLGDYYELSRRVFRLSTRGLPRGEFFRQLLPVLIEFCGCDATELRLREGHVNYFTEMIGASRRSFRFGVIDAAHSSDGGGFPCVSDGSPLERISRAILQGLFDPNQACFTEKGAFWTGNLTDTVRELGKSRAWGLQESTDFASEYVSFVIVPFVVEGEDVGLLQLKSRREDFFTRMTAEFYEALAPSIGAAMAERRTYWKLGERLKEMTCLYGISELAARPGISVEEVLRGIVKLLPPAMQYSEITVAKIELDGVVYATDGYQDGPYALSADIVVGDSPRGIVEVRYMQAMQDCEPEMFLREEESLVGAVAHEIQLVLGNRQAQEESARLQEQIRHADRLATLGQLAAGVAHELNEPLGSVLGFAQLIKKEASLPEQVGKDLDKILGASLRARDVVKKLLIFAREMPTITSTVNLNAVVQDALSLLISTFDQENVECVLSLTDPIPDITADRTQLHQVVINLVVNAIQAMPEGGKLTIGTGADETWAYLRVEDTGVGMGREVLRSIFLPFYTTKDVGEGTGLGLSVVHGIVTSHGGAIDVQSEPGKGSQFKIRLPRRAE